MVVNRGNTSESTCEIAGTDDDVGGGGGNLANVMEGGSTGG